MVGLEPCLGDDDDVRMKVEDVTFKVLDGMWFNDACYIEEEDGWRMMSVVELRRVEDRL